MGGFYTAIQLLVGFVVLVVFLSLGSAAACLPLPYDLPPPVAGFALLGLALLVLSSCIPSHAAKVLTGMQTVAGPLLRHLGLFFVPAGVGIVAEGHVLAAEWLPIALALLFSTVAGLAAAGWTMQRLSGPASGAKD